LNPSTPTLEALLPDESATERVGELLAQVLKRGDFVGLEGKLGAGKTCLTRGILRRLSEGVRVTSPTYTLINEYEGAESFPLIVHADLYRLRDEDDLESTGYWDAIAEADLLIVEWVDQIPAAMPERGWRVCLDHAEGGRQVRVMWVGAGAELRLSELRRLWPTISR
jgi:tRNA threonylcarbamoyladenosine biosynthesis protein TsaE